MEGGSWRRKSAERVDHNRSKAVTGFRKGLKSAPLPLTPTLHPTSAVCLSWRDVSIMDYSARALLLFWL